MTPAAAALHTPSFFDEAVMVRIVATSAQESPALWGVDPS